MKTAKTLFGLAVVLGLATVALVGCHASKGSCPSPDDCACPCSNEAAQVCSTDGKAYLNKCMLECDGQALGVCLALCAPTCTGAADCGNAADWQCVNGACKPVVTPECATSDDCRIDAAGWTTPNTPCSTDANCGGGRFCIAYGGKTWCARHNCIAPNPLSVPKAQDATVSVEVCWNGTLVCEAGTCFQPCTADGSCQDAAYPKCDLASGHCVCNGTSCAAEANAPVCLASGVCGCGANSDCKAPGTDTCFAGVCGCSAASVCGAIDATVTWACQ